MRCLRPALLRVVARFALAVVLLATRFLGRLFGLFGSIGIPSEYCNDAFEFNLEFRLTLKNYLYMIVTIVYNDL